MQADHFPTPRLLSSHKSRPSLSTSALSYSLPLPPSPTPASARKSRDSIGSASSLASVLPQYPDPPPTGKENAYKPARMSLLGQPPPYWDEGHEGLRRDTADIGAISVTNDEPRVQNERDVEQDAQDEEYEDDDMLDDLIRRSSEILATATKILESTRSSRDYFRRFNSLEDSLSLSLFDQEHSIRRELDLAEDLEGKTDDLAGEVERVLSGNTDSSRRREERERQEKAREEKEKEAKDPRSLLMGDGGNKSPRVGKGHPPRVRTIHLNSKDAETLFNEINTPPSELPTPSTSSSYFGTSSGALTSLLQNSPVPSTSTSLDSPIPPLRRSSTSAIALLSSLQQPSSSTTPSAAGTSRRSSLTPTLSSSLLSPQFSSSSFGGISTINENEIDDRGSLLTAGTTPPSSRPPSPCPTPTPTTPRKHNRAISSPPTLSSPTNERIRRVSVTGMGKVNIGEDRTNAVASRHGRTESGLKERLEAMKKPTTGTEEEAKGWWWR